MPLKSGFISIRNPQSVIRNRFLHILSAPDGVPALVDPIEGGEGDFVTLLVLVVERSGLHGHSADRVGELVTSAEHLEIDPLMGRLLRVITKQIQPFPDPLEPLLARTEALLERSLFLEMHSGGIARVLEGAQRRRPL